MRIAVVGTGIAGLVCAHLLDRHHDLTVFEAEDRPGGHTQTIEVDVGGRSRAVDIGFLVYNERTYPGLVRLFARLGVATMPSDMSFSVADEASGVEYSGRSLATVFAQPANLARPAFWRMLADIARFNRAARRLLEQGPPLGATLADQLATGHWSRAFVDWYLIPLGASIWSAGPSAFLSMPAEVVAHFFWRHGMLSFGDRPVWRTVRGGAARYVEAIVAPLRARGRLRLSSPVRQVLRAPGGGVEITSTSSPVVERFDHVILATHSDQALALLGDASVAEREILGAIAYQDNELTVHRDTRLLPRARRAWAAWNYHRPAEPTDRVTITYDLNRLQPLGASEPPVLVTLNRDADIAPAAVVRRLRFSHPILGIDATRAQRRRQEIDGRDGISYCGAYFGSGFHEDGLQSALDVCRRLGARW